MGNSMPNNFLRMAIGVSAGVFAYRFSKTAKGRMLKNAIVEGVAKLAKLAGRTENIAETFKDKAMKAV